MPIVTIHVLAETTAEECARLSEIVHATMVETINCPEDALYHCIQRHAPGEMLFTRSYAGAVRSDRMIILEMTMKSGRTPEQKQAMYALLCSRLRNELGIERQDLAVIITDNAPSDWFTAKTPL